MKTLSALVAVGSFVAFVSSGGSCSSTSSGGSGSGGAPANGSGGAVTSSGGVSSSGGVTSSGGVSSSGGVTSSGGHVSSGGAAGLGGTPGSGGRGGASTAIGGAGGGDSGCTRALLKNTIDAYFTALAAHDPSTLPLATGVKFTENGKVVTIGTAGLWKTAGMVKYTQSALDTQFCTSGTEAVVPDGSTDIPFALRLKLENQKITEAETIAVHPGDYSVASNTAAIIASAATVKWEDTVPTDQSNTRADITGWMDKYFRSFPNGVCNVTSDCIRLENGGGSYACSAGATCTAGTPSGTPAIVSHVIIADVDTGIGVGFDLFMKNADMHMFKMYGGKVHAVHAVLGAATSTGWD